MAGLAEELINDAAIKQYPALFDRGTLMCLLSEDAFNTTGLTAQEAMDGAAAAGYQALSDADLNKCLLVALQA